MTEEQTESTEQEAPPPNKDSKAVQAALKGIPGLADRVGSRPAPADQSDPMAGIADEGESSGEPAIGTPRKPVEDSDTVQKALRQLGLK